MKNYYFRFVVGSQLLYGPEVLETVEQRGREMAAELSKKLPFPLKFDRVITKEADALDFAREANTEPECAGIITWCHTFSPSKLWAQALQRLQKPWCHFATQYHKEIPNDAIDMDFMNLNQAAHGDREHGFIGMRLDRPRKVVVGHWQEDAAAAELAGWMRAAVATQESRTIRILRFGDNMRDVAVTDGDKIETLLRLGWQVDYWPVGELVERMGEVTDEMIDAKVAEYRARYTMNEADIDAIRIQARMEIALRVILERENASAVVTNFQDLYGLDQLPGLAVQNLMADGYGFGAEGDWKTAGLTALMKRAASGLPGGTSFVEDYSYDYNDEPLELAAHMLEICPTLSSEKAAIEVHPLGIGGKNPPARLVFAADPGAALVATLVDFGGRMRMILQDVTCVKAPEMPCLPVARIMWKPEPDLRTGLNCWIMAGGGHHSVLSNQLDASIMRDWAEMMGIEVLYIHAGTELETFRDRMMLSELYWKLR